mmetsp:Transcript_11925/g.44356  ORF Transcript_11925/g.44356 Transcript_11925/m.44356 type:complete len:266 (-) Transcript_11925:3533-4330(-)
MVSPVTSSLPVSVIASLPSLSFTSKCLFCKPGMISSRMNDFAALGNVNGRFGAADVCGCSRVETVARGGAGVGIAGAPKSPNAAMESMPSSCASPPTLFTDPDTRVFSGSFAVPLESVSVSSESASPANRTTATAKDKSRVCLHTSCAASFGCPASTKKAAANKYRCFESSAYAFFSAACLFLVSEKSLAKKSATSTFRVARHKPASTLCLPRATKRSAHGVSPAGSFVSLNACLAAWSHRFRNAVSSRIHKGTPRLRNEGQLIF